MGYTEEPLPPFTPYAPPMLDQPLMEGAIEEHQGPHPIGLVPDLSELLDMPDACLLRHLADLPIGAAQFLATSSHALTTHKHQVRKLHRKLNIGAAAAKCISDHKCVGKRFGSQVDAATSTVDATAATVSANMCCICNRA